MTEAIPASLRAELVQDAARYEFEPPHPRSGGAFAMASLTRADSAPRRFAEWLASTAGAVGLHAFAPNEASYQRYTRTGRGLPPHRDQRYYVQTIAIVTLVGEAVFAVHGSADRDDVVAEWRTQPGQVVLLRGWDPSASADVRPFHRVDAPTTPDRLMLQLRQNMGADGSPAMSRLTPVEREQALHLAARPPTSRTMIRHRTPWLGTASRRIDPALVAFWADRIERPDADELALFD